MKMTRLVASMGSTTHTDFGATANTLDVAATFPGSIIDRTILITDGNRQGIGYATAEAFAK